MKTIHATKKELAAERAALDRIGEKTHSIHIAVVEAESRLHTAQRALEQEKKEKTPLAKSFESAIARARTDLAARRSELDAARQESAGQLAKITQLEAVLEQRELEDQRIAFAPSAKELYAAFDLLIAVAAKIDTTLEQTGPADLSEILFPMRNTGGWMDYGKNSMRNALIEAFNAGMRASRLKVEYDPAKEVAA